MYFINFVKNYYKDDYILFIFNICLINILFFNKSHIIDKKM